MQAKAPGAKYLARARALAEAIDVGTVIAKAESDVAWQEWEALFRTPALTPEPAFATLKSLTYLEDAFFTYWNEASGAHVERFWQQVAERGLPFQRKELVREVLARGRIRNEMEYQTIVDSWLIQQQLGRISEAEAQRLSGILEKFEQRAKIPGRSG
jgi:hypothetical protein